MNKSLTRYTSLDVIRGFATLGILIINIVGFSMPFDAYSNPLSFGVHTSLDYGAWIVTDLFFIDAMRGLFSMLYGASLIMLSQKQDDEAARKNYFTRSTWLLIFGLIHSYIFLMSGDILFPYAVSGMILYYFRNHDEDKLIRFGVIILIVKCLIYGAVTIGSFYLGKYAKFDEELLTLWNEVNPVVPIWDEVNEETAVYKGGYKGIFYLEAINTFIIQTLVMVMELFWDIIIMMFIGMGLYKKRILFADYSKPFYINMMIVGYTVGLAINILKVYSFGQDEIPLTTFLGLYALKDIAKLGLVMGHLAVIILILKLGIASSLTERLANVGRMALSNYLMQTIICIFLFYGFGFNLYNEVSRIELWGIIVMVWVFQIFFSGYWLERYYYGPFEWVWRTLTLKKRITLKKPL